MTLGNESRSILQDLRQFTVKIRNPDSETIVGTGVLISIDGLIVTCAHVVHAAGVDPQGTSPRIGVYLPALRDRAAIAGKAEVVWYPHGHDDDVVCLRFIGKLPLREEQVAAVGQAQESLGHRFISYGYRKLQHYPAGFADGLILGAVDAPHDMSVLAEPIQLRSSQIDAGMSGAAVLDTERNLVVGIVSEAWYSEIAGKDRDTSWAVDGRVLTFSHVPIPLRADRLPLARAEVPPADSTLSQLVVPHPGHRMDTAPVALDDWVGRTQLLGHLEEAWNEDRIRVVGMIGFGGEGKSSIARRWVDAFLGRTTAEASVFWWSFSEQSSAEEFLSALVDFLSGGQITATEVRKAGDNLAELAAKAMRDHRYLLILDGLEVMQHQRGDEFGSLLSDELRDFLRFAAAPEQRSLCLLTSRVPVLDLAPYVTYQQIGVTPLSFVEGRRLLRTLGVVGSDAALEQVVRDWHGHALTLTLLATYLVRRHRGDVRRVASLPSPDFATSPSEQVHRILRQYDECLSEAERQVLIRCSVFRIPVALQALAATTDPDDWAHVRSTTVNYLLEARILRLDANQKYRLHPLIRSYYAEQGRADAERWRQLHRAAYRHFKSILDGTSPSEHSLEELEPAIEAVHHCCGAGLYGRAADLVDGRLYRGDRAMITNELNAYETTLSVMSDFYPRRELHGEPLVVDAATAAWLLHETATCLQMLGRLREAASMFRRASDSFQSQGEWHDAAISCQNTTELFLHLGTLPKCHSQIAKAFELADLTGDKEDELVAETLSGTLAHLEGRRDDAERAFAAALGIASEFTPIPALYSSSGIKYAEMLFRAGQLAAAARVHRVNIEISTEAGWLADIAQCHIGIGDIALVEGDRATAEESYEHGLRIARRITRRDVLIAALMGRGRWRLHAGLLDGAMSDIDASLQMAQLGGYLLAQVDARILLARLLASIGDREAAWSELAEAEEVSIELGYFWGQHDVAEVRADLTT